MSTWKQTAGKGGGEFERAPAGNHPAVLIGLIDMGTQENNYQGNITWQHRAFFVYELVTEKMQSAPGRNHILAIDLTVSMNEKAKLRKFIEGRLGRQVPDGTEYEISQEVGQPVMLNVVMNKDGYPKIENVSSVPKGITMPTPQNAPVVMTLDDFRAGKPIPAFCPWLYGEPLADHIKRCQEITGKGKAADQPAPPPAPATANGSGSPVPPPPPNGGPPAPPSGPAGSFWVDLGGGKVSPQPVEGNGLAHFLLEKGLTPQAQVMPVGGSDWKPAETFGVKLPF